MENVANINIDTSFYAKVKRIVKSPFLDCGHINCVWLGNLTSVNFYNQVSKLNTPIESPLLFNNVVNEKIYVNPANEEIFENIDDRNHICSLKQGQIIKVDIESPISVSIEETYLVKREQLSNLVIKNVDIINEYLLYKEINTFMSNNIEKLNVAKNCNYDTEYTIKNLDADVLFSCLSPIGRGIYHILQDSKDQFGYVSKNFLLENNGLNENYKLHLNSLNYGLKELEQWEFLDKYLTYSQSIYDLHKGNF